jgi:hypothetical protein
MMNNQSSSAVYGLFHEGDEATALLGIYFLEGEAVAARAQYIEEEMSDFAAYKNDLALKILKTYEATVYVAQLPVGSKPDFYFVKR